MSFTFRYPHNYLRQYIDCYWIARNDKKDCPERFVSVFPITMHNLVLFPGNIPGTQIVENGTKEMPRKCIIGMITKRQNYLLKDEYYFVCIRFKPTGIYRFFDLKPSDFVDGIIDYDTSKINELYHQIGDTNNESVIVNALDNFFLSRLFAQDYKDDLLKQVKYSVNKINCLKGNIHFNTMYNELNCSERTFRNLFQDYTGLSPKRFSRIVKFNYAYQQLISNQHISIHDIIYHAGYYDQSHFIKEFKYFTESNVKGFHTNFKEFDQIHRLREA